MKKTIGILAHVDAGKTTFSESVLYLAGSIRRKGRVDHRDTFLDTDPMEMARGITIFSGQAHFSFGEDEVFWLDTPGHADFSAEMERAVRVMDCAILLISACDGVQPHTETVWQILERSGVPTFLFLNKCDRPDADADQAVRQIAQRLSPDLLDLRGFPPDAAFTSRDDLTERIALWDDSLMDAYFSGDIREEAWEEALREGVRTRRVFPVMAGSALTGEGVEACLRLVLRLSGATCLPAQPLRAVCYRVRHEGSGQRLCFLKLLSGTLSVKDTVTLPDGSQEKVNEIRIYSGEKYQHVPSATAGDLVAVPLSALAIGGGIGETPKPLPPPQAMTSAELLYDRKATPPFRMLQLMRQLEDEDPSLGVTENGDRISVRVIGPMQLEILAAQVQSRFGIPVSFGPPQILYHETVSGTSIGIGHYEPLRHYAEVHLRISPGPRGSGVVFRSFAHVDDLALNWQRLIQTHVYEKAHKGILTGAPLTDVVIDLLCGRAHLKHTEGGDFRQATYRAIRNALMYSESILLEPVCRFDIRTASDQAGTITSALSRLQAELDPPEYTPDTVHLTGTCIYARFLPFQDDFSRLTHGLGILRVQLEREVPCHNQEEVVAASGYQPLADDTPDSVFCSHGAGFTVAWDHVRDFAHLPDPEPETLNRETQL